MNVKEILQIADKGTLDKCLEILRRIDANTFDAQTMDWGAWFASRKTGELFSTKFYNYDVTDTGIGELLNASAGLSCTPSTDKVKGQDDFASHNAFWYVDCNFIVNDQGVRIPTYIDGQSGFSRTGKVQVGVLTPPLYWGEEIVSDGYIKHFSDSEHPTSRPDLNLTLMPHCRDGYGNPMPYGIVPKYYAGDIDGLMYGSSGLAVKNFASFNSVHTELQKLGIGYLGAGSERTAYLKNFLWIKYATSNSQKYFRGCTSCNFQYAATEAASGVNYITLAKAQANNFYIGCTVSIGEAGESAATSIDRGNAYMRNIADKVLVTKIEAVDDTYSRVYVDSEPFDVTTTTYISSMPLHSGQTDTVLGNDGQIANDGKHSFKIQGVEEGIGTYYVSANECEYKETADKTIFYNRAGAEWSNTQTDIQENWKEIGSYESADGADFWIGEETIDLETGSGLPKTVGAGDAKGTGDRRYHGSTGTEMREKLERGGLGSGSHAGLSCSYGGYSLSSAVWYCAACVS
ncbi:MAG: hypothetical protein Q4F15_06255 [Bacillota bacterium]|nr:hypothetical protein [Bacillota bacterium]